MAYARRPLVWLSGEIKTPPFSADARLEAGVLLRRVQRGDKIQMPHGHSLPELGARCGELRVPDDAVTWRILYRSDPDAVIIADVFAKKTQAIPAHILARARARLRQYDRTIHGDD